MASTVPRTRASVAGRDWAGQRASDGDADAATGERDGERAERAHGHAGGENPRHEGEPPPRRKHEPRGVVDQYVLEHPGRERVAPDGQQPARAADSGPLEHGGGRERERRYGACQGDEAAGTEYLVE